MILIIILRYFKYILTYSKHEHAVYLVFSRAVFRVLPSISNEVFVKIDNDLQSLTIFAKSAILIFWQGSEYTSAEAATGGVL